MGSRDPLGAQVFADSVLPILEAGLGQPLAGDETVADGLRFRKAEGHSPGHCAIELDRNGGRAIFVGDIMHQPVQVYRPEWNSAFCFDPAAARLARRWALETAAETGAVVRTAHFADSSAGIVTERNGRFAWRFVEP